MNTNPLNTNPVVDLSEGGPVVPAVPGVPVPQDAIAQDARRFSAFMERRRGPQLDTPRDDPMSDMTAGSLAAPGAAPLTGPLSGTLIGKQGGAAGSPEGRSLPVKSSLDRFADEVQDKVNNMRDEAAEAGAIPQSAMSQMQQGVAVDLFMAQRGSDSPPVRLSVQARIPAPAAAHSAISGSENWPTQKAPDSNDLHTSYEKLDAVWTAVKMNPSNTAPRAVTGASGAMSAQQSLRPPVRVPGLGNVELGCDVVAGMLPATPRTPAAKGVPDASGLTAASPVQSMQVLQAPSYGAKPAPQAGEAPAMLSNQTAMVADVHLSVNDKAAGSSMTCVASGAADAADATDATDAAQTNAATAQPIDVDGNAGAAPQSALTHTVATLALTPGQMKARMQKRKPLGLDGGLPGRAAEQPQALSVRPTQASREKTLAVDAAAQARGVVVAPALLRPNTQHLPVVSAALTATVAPQVVSLHSVAPGARAMPSEVSTPAPAAMMSLTMTREVLVPAVLASASAAPAVTTPANPAPVGGWPVQPQLDARAVPPAGIAGPTATSSAELTPSGKVVSPQVAAAVVSLVPNGMTPEVEPELAQQISSLPAPELMPAISHDLPPGVADPGWSLTAEQQTEQVLAPAAAHAPDMPGAPPAPMRQEREMRVAEVAVAQVRAQELRLAIVNTPESQIEAALKAL